MGKGLKVLIRKLFREEQTDLWKLVVCKLISTVGCVAYSLRYASLRRRTRNGFDGLRAVRAPKALVLANGPSVGDLDFEKIGRMIEAGELDLIVVNSFASKGIRQFGVKPFLAVFADPAHYINLETHRLSAQLKEDIAEVNRSGATVLVPYHYLHASRFENPLPYYGRPNIYGKNVSDLSRPLAFYTVTAMQALGAALHLGYAEVFICGFDNSYFKSFGVDESGEKYFNDTHFYDEGDAGRRYLPAEKYGPTSAIFYDTYLHFKYLERIYRERPAGVNVFNIARTTYTEAFPRYFGLDVYREPEEACGQVAG